MAKPLEEYFDGTGVVYDGDRVYLSDYHYKKHMNYVNSLEKNARFQTQKLDKVTRFLYINRL